MVINSEILKINQELVDHIKSSRLFSHWPQELIDQLIPLSELRDFESGSEILIEGQENEKVFFLIRGSVRVHASGQLILKLRRKGDIFGEMSIISNKPCLASVVADTQIKVFSIKARDIGKFTDVDSNILNHTLYRVFAMVLTDKLAMTTFKAKQYEVSQRELTDEIITRKQVENDLRKEESQYRMLLESIPDSVYVLNREWQHLIVNDARSKNTGIPKNQLIGNKLTDLFPDLKKTPFFKTLKNAMKTRKNTTITDEFIFSDGRKEWQEIRVYPVREGILVISRNITDKKNADLKIKNYSERAERHKTAIQQLAKIDLSRFEDTIRHITEEATNALRVDRVGFWLFIEDNTKLLCKDLYLRDKDIHQGGMELLRTDYPNYFDRIDKLQDISIVDPLIDKNTKDFKENHLEPQGILSKIDVGFFFQGKICGILSCEHLTHIREWSEDEKTFINTMTDIISLSFEASKRKKLELELKEHHEHLEELIDERTNDLKNEIAERKKTQQDLQYKMTELERFSRMAYGRELQMIKLKEEINGLRINRGEAPKFKIVR